MYILGISCFYHDSAACLIKDGEIIAAVQEERFTRLKHDWRLPINAINYCLKEANISIEDIDAVSFYEKPLLKFERMLETFMYVAPRGYRAFIDTIPSWIRQKLWLPTILKKQLGYRGRILFSMHHLSHAAGCFFLSPFDESAILTIDGVGEWATASYGYGRNNKITITHEMRFPNSLGLLYSAFTSYLGFEVNDAEYKVMGMAPYGKPNYYDIIKDKIVDVREDGSIRLNLDYFSFHYGRKMFNKKFEAILGEPKRMPESPLRQGHFDIAASLQKLTEDIVMKMAFHVHKEINLKNLCLAGGVSLNCVANGRLLKEGPFREIFIQPAAGDAGGSIGAAYAAYHHYYNKIDRHPLKSTYLGPSYDEKDIIEFLEKNKITFVRHNEEEIITKTARLLSEGKIIGWFQGRMEFGPRALGNRSILADPSRPEMKDIINKKVKFREPFRPFAPAVTNEDAPKYFELNVESPYMLLTAKVKSKDIPAVTHIDGSARVQTVSEETNPLFYKLLKKFGEIKGIPILLNTSLNLRGEPIAMTPEDAYKCFIRSGMDHLVIGNFIISKVRIQ